MAASCCSSHCPGIRPSAGADRRPLPPFEPGQSQLRFDQATGQWVIIAARRQDRTYKPPADQCPLCPGPTGLTSEVPAPDYDVVVFENRFPSLSGAGPAASVPDGFVPAPGVGRCEVICFSSNHSGSFAELPVPHARLVVEAWRHRTGELLAVPGVQQVFCFENRGEEIGVTLAHPHGQIYGYSYLTPRTAAMMEQAVTQGRQPVCRSAGIGGRRRQPDRGAHRSVHRVRAVRRALAGRGAHLPEQVRAQPFDLSDGRARRVRGDLPRRAATLRPDVFRPTALHFGAAPILRIPRIAGGLLPRRADVDPAQRYCAEISGGVRIGDGRVHHRRGARSCGRSACGNSRD